MTEEKMMVEYQTQHGDMLKLTLGMVKNYLVHGKKELATEQEIVFFMHTCKARKLNPFLKDCYLMKYDNSPAAIITSRDYFTKNAWKNKTCQGWRCGITVENDGKIIERDGCIMHPDDTLVGAWFRATPKDRQEMYHSIPLNPYIKRRRDGSVTQFWQPEKQPEMIVKVVEVQGLRKIWGEESTGMYTPEEMPSLESVQPEFKPMAQTAENLKDEILKPAEKQEVAKEIIPVEENSEPEISDTTAANWYDLFQWKDKKTTGFTTWCEKHQYDWGEVPEDIFSLITAKWEKLNKRIRFPLAPSEVVYGGNGTDLDELTPPAPSDDDIPPISNNTKDEKPDSFDQDAKDAVVDAILRSGFATEQIETAIKEAGFNIKVNHIGSLTVPALERVRELLIDKY